MKRNAKIGLGIGAGLLVVAALVTPESEKTEHRGKPAAAKAVEPEFRKMHGLENWAMIADAEMTPEAYEIASRKQCGGKSFCSVYAWTDRSQVATALPMLDREVAAQVYSYTLNRTTNFERSLWNCAVFPSMADKEGDRCLATGD